MNEHRDEVRFEPVSPHGVSRTVPIVTFLIGIFIGAALVKPWDFIFPALTTQIDHGPPVAAVSPTPAPSPALSPTPSPSSAPAECAFAGGWRIFAVGERDRLGGDGSTVDGAEPSGAGNTIRDVGNPLRRWLEILPLDSVSGPDDANIPFVTIVSLRITAIGYCPPPGESDRPPREATLKAWSLDGSGAATSLPLEQIKAGGPITTEVEVFIGSRDVAAGGRWAAGRYVFAVASPDLRYGRWFGLEIRTPPGPPT